MYEKRGIVGIKWCGKRGMIGINPEIMSMMIKQEKNNNDKEKKKKSYINVRASVATLTSSACVLKVQEASIEFLKKTRAR